MIVNRRGVLQQANNKCAKIHEERLHFASLPPKVGGPPLIGSKIQTCPRELRYGSLENFCVVDQPFLKEDCTHVIGFGLTYVGIGRNGWHIHIVTLSSLNAVRSRYTCCFIKNIQ